jgi:hypothetical protein
MQVVILFELDRTVNSVGVFEQPKPEVVGVVPFIEGIGAQWVQSSTVDFGRSFKAITLTDTIAEAIHANRYGARKSPSQAGF